MVLTPEEKIRKQLRRVERWLRRHQEAFVFKVPSWAVKAAVRRIRYRGREVEIAGTPPNVFGNHSIDLWVKEGFRNVE